MTNLKSNSSLNSSSNSPLNKQRGVALIIVLLLVALMTTVAVQMSDRLWRGFYRTEGVINHQQAYWYGVGVEALTKVVIEQSLDDSDTVNLNQAWATENQIFPLDRGQAEGQIFDMSSCFNLNSLSAAGNNGDDGTTPFLVEYLKNLAEESGIESYQAEVIAESARDFIDSDSETQSSYGAEDSEYQSKNPPYLPSNSWVADVSEFRSINGINAPNYFLLRPYLCALPSSDFILNVNTITADNAVLLSALFSPALSLDDAKRVIEDRPFDGWDTVEAFLAEPAISGLNDETTNKIKEYLAVDSHYFQLEGVVTVDRINLRVASLFVRDDNNKVTVIRRLYGGLSERVSHHKTE
ncbi:type II secretion system minor pseudopilin GspK [Vibrio sp. SS-MA-C1-2]|uniref:type II secretion system minor pseudopilin GspK n=1 Tax=Vibrio sp. SS-MA-C1-2 TaxID=2908646 RepID=UPI001F43F063|nr:type II secretion system minor pseudopilin GspK [Vibrio sp. SS-MA-C1-2]UJF19448.1 type II secretion system minor pseudopilin GspK [Vibrio sp. SS-MA-C1-2]